MLELSADLVRRALTGPAPFSVPAADGPLSPAAIVVPVVFEGDASAWVVVRSEALAEHAGELGFPGGKPEAEDASLSAAALRELAEETGVSRSSMLGALTPVPVVTGRYLIHPFVAEVSGEPTLSGEIAELLRVPIEPWIDGRLPIAAAMTRWRGAEFLLPHFEIGRHVLYGASACVFYDLLFRVASALGRTLPPLREVAEPPWRGRYDDQ